MTQPEFRSTLKALGMSQRELARRLGVAVSTVSAWATGKTPVPTYVPVYFALLSDYLTLLNVHMSGV